MMNYFVVNKMKNLTFVRNVFIFFLLLFPQLVLISQTESNDTFPEKTKEESDVDKPAAMPSQSLNLKWLINEALEHNPEIIAVHQRLKASKARISQAKSLDDPMFRAGSFDMSNHPLNINGQTGMLQQRYTISQKIPFPGKLDMREKVATQESKMVEEDLQAKIQEITAEVKTAFYDLFYVNRAIAITEENRELLRKFTKIAETKYAVGNTSQRDVLSAQVELSTLTNELIVLNKEKESVIARINVLLDRHPQHPLGEPPLIEMHHLDMTLEELEDLAARNRPELKKYDHAIKRNEAQLKLSKKDYYYTDFEPMVEYMQEDGKSDTWASAISINIPWLWPKNRSRVKEAKDDLHAAKSDYRYINNKTLFEVKDYFVKLQSSESTVNLFKTGIVPQAEQSLKAAEIGYETDTIDFLSLIDSQRMLLNSQLHYYKSVVDYETNLANLERAVGIQLVQ
ncbi:MAG: TolC family protein [Candidatus Kuenenia sp.]|nr:TolC family protein [Candidatus Kuenenia hertensis]